MKKTTVIIWILIAVILGIVAGVIASIVKDSKLEQAQVNEIIKVNELIEKNAINYVANEVIETNNSETKLSPNAVIYFEQYYTGCGHTIIQKKTIDSLDVNKTEEEFGEDYSEWTVKKFTETEVRLYKEVEGTCEQHYLISVDDEHVVVYTIDEDGETTLKEVTDILIQYLTEEDVELLKQGIRANGETELTKTLEDFE